MAAFSTRHASIEASDASAFSARTNATASARSTFDSCGQELTNIEPGSVASQTVTTYYPNGSVNKVVNSDGTWEIDHYDEADNNILTETSSDDGTQSATSLVDIGGRTVSETDADGNVTTHAFDLADHETAAASQDQSASATTMNTLGWQLSQRDADGITTADSYDLDGRVTSETVGGLTTSTTFDALANAVKIISPDLSVRTVSFDKLGRQSGESQVTSLGVSIRGAASVFDSLSRTVDSTETLSSGSHWTQTHNEFAASASKPSTVTVTRDGRVSIVSNYDSLGEQTIATAQVATSTPVIRSLGATDAAGRETAWTIGGKSVGQVFDSASHLTAQTGLGFTSPGTMYVYSQTSGKKTSEALPFAFASSTENATYAYDSVSRLATWAASGVCGLAGSVTATYSYNAQSAITTVGLSAAAGPWAKGATVFAYSGAGVLASKSTGGVTARTYGYDPATGARISEKPSGSATMTVYAWVGGRLARYSDSSKGTTSTYSYDANGQRTRSIVASAGGTTSTDYVYQGLSLLSLSATSSGNASYTIDYLYDGSERPYAGFYRDESTAAVTAFDIVTTDRGDVAELTDVSGTAFALYRYDPWGNSLSTTSSAGSMVATLAAVISARQPLRYAGYAYDSESGLYYCSARYYDPVTCQFISKDAARAGGEMTPYGYCGGDSVGAVDPSGQRLIHRGWYTFSGGIESRFGLFHVGKRFTFGFIRIRWGYQVDWYYRTDDGALWVVVTGGIWDTDTGSIPWYGFDVMFDGLARVMTSGTSSYVSRMKLIDGAAWWSGYSAMRPHGDRCYATFFKGPYYGYWIKRISIGLLASGNTDVNYGGGGWDNVRINNPWSTSRAGAPR